MESIQNLNQLRLEKLLIKSVQIQGKRNMVSFSPKTKVAASLSLLVSRPHLSLGLGRLSL